MRITKRTWATRWWLPAVLMLVGLVACGGEAPATERTVEIASWTIACPGDADQSCLLGRETGATQWRVLRHGVDGFVYEPGSRWELVVQEYTEVVEGQTQSRWELVRVVEKSAEIPGSTRPQIDQPVSWPLRLLPDQRQGYDLLVAAGQIVAVALDSADPTVHLRIHDRTGQLLHTGTRWATRADRETLWAVIISPGPESADAVFSVAYPAVLVPGMPGVADGLAAGEIAHYAWDGVAGDLISVTVDSPANELVLVISGLHDGTLLVAAAAGLSAWVGTLPSSQPYGIQVINVGEETGYLLAVGLPDS